MEILVISGFLGAGKTTFISAMAKATGKKFVLIENEFAEANIDAQVMKTDEGDEMKVWELTEGCICCSLNLDFSLSVLTIANSLHPDYLVVEPSGVAQPSNILEGLGKIEYEQISLLAPVTILDGEHYAQHRREYRNYFMDQMISAGTVVVSRSEDWSEGEFDHLAAQLDLPGDVWFPKRHYSQWSPQEWERIFLRKFSAKDLDRVGERFREEELKDEADEDLKSLTFRRLHMESPLHAYGLLSRLAHGSGGDVVRAKGFVTTPVGKLHLELAGGRYGLIGIEEDEVEEDAFVVIGKHLHLEEVGLSGGEHHGSHGEEHHDHGEDHHAGEDHHHENGDDHHHGGEDPH
ncbi:MAG: GTP-binding protein [Tissierellia bacterium]|nr:GTP-binding protein [Tissierellia bacterium]